MSTEKEYIVEWTKTYHASGTIKIKALSAKEAEDKMDAIIGDQEGSMQYDPDKNTIEVFKKMSTMRGME